MSGDPTAAEFETLIRPHLDRLYRLAYRLTLTVADAQDLVQDVLVKLYPRRDELSSIDDLTPWLSRVLYNQFVQQTRRYRSQRFRVVLETDGDPMDSLAGPGEDPAEEALRSFDISEVRSALGRLSEDHRTVLLMHDAEGYKLQEIQIITGISVGTIKSRLHRARARLRELLTADGTFSGPNA